MSDKKSAPRETKEASTAKNADVVRYVGSRISTKQMKRMLIGLSPEARTVFKANLCPGFKVRQDAKGTMGVYKEEDRVKRRVN